MRDMPMGTSEEDSYQQVNFSEPIPRTHEFPIGIDFSTQIITYDKIVKHCFYSQEYLQDDLSDKSGDLCKTPNIAFGTRHNFSANISSISTAPTSSYSTTIDS